TIQIGPILRSTGIQASVTKRDVEVSIRPERQLAAIVVGLGLREFEDDASAVDVRHIVVLRADLVACDYRFVRRRRDVAYEEVSVVLEIRVEREAKEAGLAAIAINPVS